MKRWAVFLLAAGWALGVWAQSPTANSGFVVLRTASSTNIFYDCDVPTVNPDYTNTVTYIYQGENLFLGAEVTTPRYSCNSSEAGVDTAFLRYTVDGGVTNVLNLPRIVAGSPDKWQEATSTGMVEIGSAWSVGTHTVAVYFVVVDVNHCIAPGISGRLPSSGYFTAAIEVRAGAYDVRACDAAGDPAYSGGWTNGSNGGYGFGPWTTLVSIAGDGDAAGFFLGTNPPNADLNYVTSRGRAWAMYANESGSTNLQEDAQLAGAFRTLNQPLQEGQTFVLDFEHGGILAGSLSENTPPRTGGWVGFALRSDMPEQFGDPDPFSALGALQNAQVAVGFHGGDANYSVYDLDTPSGRDTGFPFTYNGVRAALRLTGTDTYELTLTPVGPLAVSNSIVITGHTGGGLLGVVGLYDRNAEQADTYFNRMAVLGPAVPGRAAQDDAADVAYTSGWATNSNGGIGFDPWLIAAFPGAGSAGFFLATNPPNTDLNGIASRGRAWGMYANDNPGGGVQSVTAYRYFSQGALKPGQVFGMSLEHGGIASINGSVEIALIGTPTFPNPQGEVLYFRFSGGGSSYTLSDSGSTFGTDIPFSYDGLRFDFQMISTNSPARYALTIDARGANGGVYRFCGRVDSAPRALRFRITDVEENDVFLNRLYITADYFDPDGDGLPSDWEIANGTDPGVYDAYDDPDGDGSPNVLEYIAGTNPLSSNSVFRGSDTVNGMIVPTVTGRLYTLESTTNLLMGSWHSVTGQIDIPGTGGDLALTNTPLPAESFRTRVRMGP